MVYRRAYQAMFTAKWLYLRPDLGRITTDRLVAGMVFAPARAGCKPILAVRARGYVGFRRASSARL
jgi:hypothetical protein